MSGQVTRFLTEWRAGDPQAVERLVPLLYDELRALARRQMRRESSAHTLSATALVHDVYLRFLRQRHERSAHVVECRVFGGLTLEETARALDLSTRSVQRSWTTARAWLRKELGGHAAATP